MILDIPNRTCLFFDEHVTGTITVLTSPASLWLDITITGDNDYASFPIVTKQVTELVSTTAEKSVYKFTYPLRYPNKKLVAPQVVFRAYTKETESAQATSSDILPVFEPVFERNLLLELKISDKPLRLASTAKSTSVGVESTETIVESCVLSLPIFSSLVIRLKSTKPAGKNSELLTSFNIELSDLLNRMDLLSVQLQRFSVKFHGQIVDLNENIEFPLKFEQFESILLNYKLVNDGLDDTLKQLSVNLQFTVENGIWKSNIIETIWSPFVDFNLVAPPISSSLKTTQAKKKPVVSNYSKAASSPLLLSAYKRSTVSSSITVNLANLNSQNLLGLRLTFIGQLCIEVGQIARWKIQAINNSSSPLNVSMVIQNSNVMTSVPIQKLLTPVAKLQVYGAYKALQSNKNGVLVLDNDVRIGPMAPNTVFETEINIMGLSRGIYNLDGLNVFDVSTGDGLDFGKLVEVIVV